MMLGQIHFAPGCSILCAACEPHKVCQAVACAWKAPAGSYPLYPPATALPMGWQCPVCRRVHAPNVASCGCAVYNGPG